ncbi:GIY-YIG nuclease family protein [Flagellimonas olearia]|uniref:Excinuclease ABC subunit C n=1 Tax=Flagellimonas olearia TaxID=552546 RepID=A0A444VNH3_9FLAO|nr:GIY-YIG nuclease family protein [Allomuricauda olearia]RYC52266.1 excinuclease ABC subunit C [Allomuricauda olearia]|tara:strand:+ start:371 stop:661 length:291 start_codon:yes stop_codon:yes gene_type:complete
MKLSYVYILKCSDGTFYTGVTSNLEKRFQEHSSGKHPRSYTFSRRPIELVYFEQFTNIAFAIQREKQVKKWSRAKKEALIQERQNTLPNLAKKKFQ